MARPELMIALDFPSAAQAAAVVRRIGDAPVHYKVGLELFTADGVDTLAMLRDLDRRVFLDLKLHDIPRTVARAVAAVSRFDADWLTLHAGGGRAMMEAAAEAAQEQGGRTKLLAVTVLTSLDESDLSDLGVQRTAAQQVDALGRLAVSAGVNGLVCSPQEVGRLREVLGPEPYLVTPGIRPAGGEQGDQKRVATAAQAARDGASALVVGRPVTEAADPRAAVFAILDELAQI